MNVVLVQAPLLPTEDVREMKAMDDGYTSLVSMGLHSLAATLLDNGFQVSLLNLTLTPWREAVEAIQRRRPEVVGITCLTHDRRSVARLADDLKTIQPDLKIVLGGVHASCVFGLILRRHPAVDYIAIGEAEVSFLELVQRLERGESTVGIKGIAQRKANHTVAPDDRPSMALTGDHSDTYADIDWPGSAEPIMDLGRLAIPAKYFKYSIIATARGCPFHCSFCNSVQVWGRKVRYRPVDHVIEELTLLRDRHGMRMVTFKDETFTMHRKRVIDLCKAMIDADLQLLWSCDTRADCIDEEKLYWMRKAGCIYISFGVESGSDRMLAAIDKKINLDSIRTSAKLAREFGFLVRYYMILNLPDETEQDREASLRLIEECRPHYVTSSHLGVLPGTEVFRQYCRENNKDDSIWFDDHRVFIPYTDDGSWQETPASRRLLSFGKVNPQTGFADAHYSYSEAELREIQARFSDCFTTNYDLAICLSQRQMYADAIFFFQRALDIWPNFIRARIELGICRLYRNGSTSPRELFQSLVDTPSDDPETWFRLGRFALSKLRDYDQAERCFRNVLDLRSNHPPTLNELGHVLEQQAKYQDAIEVYQQLSSLLPRDVTVIDALARVYRQLGKFGRANQLLRRTKVRAR